jgi:transcriptional regulator with XRE-family HTH domain
MSQIGQRIRTIRKQNGQTQEGLARDAGVSNGTIIRIEMGRNRPNLETLAKIANALDVKASDLLDDDVA